MHYLRFEYLLVFLVLVASDSAEARRRSPGNKPDKPLVFVQTAKPSEIFDLLTYPARIVPTINAAVLSEGEGIVEEILVPLGHSVKQGQPIMRIKHTDPVFQYAPYVVRAPVSGVISAVQVTRGSQVKNGQELAKVTDPSKVRIEVEIAAMDFEEIKPRLRGSLLVSGRKESFPVKVLGVSPFVDPASGTATAELSLVRVKGKKPYLPPGLVGRVQFKVKNQKGFQVPEDALVYREDKIYLRFIEDNKAKLKLVSLGTRRRGMVQILEGLSEGAQFVTRSSQFVSDGEEVIVKDPEADKANAEKPKADKNSE